MSYHNGSVWPHDNALIALGLARYGHKDEVLTIFQGLFEAAVYDEFRRLPELFCGFTRRRKRGPTSYPVACSPQAWAAAAPFALVAAATGLDLGHEEGMVRLANPALPPFLDDLILRDVTRRRLPARPAPVAQRRRRHHRRHPARRQGLAGDRQIGRLNRRHVHLHDRHGDQPRHADAGAGQEADRAGDPGAQGQGADRRAHRLHDADGAIARSALRPPAGRRFARAR